MGTWQLQEAKAKLSEVIDHARKKGPQIITQRGVETVAVVPIAQWRNAETAAKASVDANEDQKREEFLRLLRSAPEFEIPDRHHERAIRRKAGK